MEPLNVLDLDALFNGSTDLSKTFVGKGVMTDGKAFRISRPVNESESADRCKQVVAAILGLDIENAEVFDTFAESPDALIKLAQEKNPTMMAKYMQLVVRQMFCFVIIRPIEGNFPYQAKHALKTAQYLADNKIKGSKDLSDGQRAHIMTQAMVDTVLVGYDPRQKCNNMPVTAWLDEDGKDWEEGAKPVKIKASSEELMELCLLSDPAFTRTVREMALNQANFYMDHAKSLESMQILLFTDLAEAGEPAKPSESTSDGPSETKQKGKASSKAVPTPKQSPKK